MPYCTTKELLDAWEEKIASASMRGYFDESDLNAARSALAERGWTAAFQGPVLRLYELIARNEVRRACTIFQELRAVNELANREGVKL